MVFDVGIMSTQSTYQQRLDLVIGPNGIYRKNGIDLKGYQVEGIRWMFTQEQKGHGGLLADEPGLGKTFQSLSLVVSDPSSLNMIVVPSSTLSQWNSDSKVLCGSSSVYVHHGSSRLSFIPKETRIVLTTPQTLCISGRSYKKYNSNYVDLQKIHWDRVIVDEVHCIKNHKSNTSKVFMNLLAKRKWGLSGTPIQNSKSEIVNLFKFVTNKKCNQVLDETLENLMDKDNGMILRRRKQDELTLPSIDIENYHIDFLTDQEKDFYIKVKNNVRSELIQAQWASPSQEMAVLMELFLRMRQTASHPQLVIDGYRRKLVKQGIPEQEARQLFPDWKSGNSSKHQKLLELIEKHPQDNSIVFTQFTQEIDILEKMFTDQGFSVARIDGKLTQDQKKRVITKCQGTSCYLPSEITEKFPIHVDKLIESFVNYRPQILLIQIKAGGVGLNLQSYNRIYITSPDWNPSNEDQAFARAWRMGQEKPVFVKRILLKDLDDKTQVIDNRILAIQDGKRCLQSKLLKDDSLICKGKTLAGRGLSKRDLNKLLR